MDEKKKVWLFMVVGAIVGGISGAETAGKLPGRIKNAIELAKTGELKKDHTEKEQKTEQE